MTSRRAISSVLHNFLGTFSSRYSEFNRYWLFGFLVGSIDIVRIDLLDMSEGAGNPAPLGVARRLAVQKFREQMQKGRVPEIWVREAQLILSSSGESVPVLVNARSCAGQELRFQARVVTNLGRAYDCTTSILVTPHNPDNERQSAGSPTEVADGC